MVKLAFDPKDLTPEEKSLYDQLVEKRKAKGAPFGGPYDALMNHPRLCEKVEALGYYLKFQGHLPRDVYQFVVLTVAQETGAAFEWQDHVVHALSAGVPEAILVMLKEKGLEGTAYPDPYRIATEVLKATLSFKSIPKDVQESAIARYGMEGFIEIVVLSGFYQMFSAINCGFDIR